MQGSLLDEQRPPQRHQGAQLHHGDRIKVRRAACQTRFLHPPGWSYYATLRRKLHWNSGTT